MLSYVYKTFMLSLLYIYVLYSFSIWFLIFFLLGHWSSFYITDFQYYSLLLQKVSLACHLTLLLMVFVL